MRVRLDRKATAISLLVVLGVRRDGQKVLLAVKNMLGESEAAWRTILDDLIDKVCRLYPRISGERPSSGALSPLPPRRKGMLENTNNRLTGEFMVSGSCHQPPLHVARSATRSLTSAWGTRAQLNPVTMLRDVGHALRRCYASTAPAALLGREGRIINAAP